MIVNVYLKPGPLEPPIDPPQRGPLFCSIVLEGDGTPGQVDFSPVPAEYWMGEDWLQSWRELLPRLLAEEDAEIGGGMDSDGRQVISFTTVKKLQPWTFRHVAITIHKITAGRAEVEWSEPPPLDPGPPVYIPKPGFEERMEQAGRYQEELRARGEWPDLDLIPDPEQREEIRQRMLRFRQQQDEPPP